MQTEAVGQTPSQKARLAAGARVDVGLLLLDKERPKILIHHPDVDAGLAAHKIADRDVGSFQRFDTDLQH